MTASGSPSPSGSTTRELVADLDRLRAGVRERGRAWWFPLTLFGALVLLALPFHVQWSQPASESRSYGWPEVALVVAGGLDSPDPVLTGAYWLVALTAGYLGTGLYYRRHALATGLRRPVRWFVTLGLVLTLVVLPFRLLFVVLPIWRSTTALVVVLLTVLVLAVRERDSRLWTVTAVLAAVTVLVNLYNVENLLFRLGLEFSSNWASLPNVALPGLVLLVGGLLTRPRRPALPHSSSGPAVAA